MAAPFVMVGIKNMVLYPAIPFIFWFMAIASIKDPKISIGMISIKNNVFPRYFQKRGSLAINFPVSMWKPRRRVKLLNPTNVGGQVSMSHFTKLNVKEANTGMEVKRRKPRKLGSKKPYADNGS